MALSIVGGVVDVTISLLVLAIALLFSRCSCVGARTTR